MQPRQPSRPTPSWSGYELTSYMPEANSYDTVEMRTDIASAAAAVQSMAQVFRGESSAVPYWQLPRMGRACFGTVAPESEDEGFLVVKGALGESPGSKSVIELQDARWRAMYGEGAGVMSLPVTAGVRFMVFYHSVLEPATEKMQSSNVPVPEIDSACAEGYTPFCSLLREYRASRLLVEPAGVPVPRALALLRREVSLPWSTAKEARQRIKDAFVAQQPAETKIVPNESEYFKPRVGLDTGLLFRLFEAAVRPQDHYDRAMGGQWDVLRGSLESGMPLDKVLSRFAIAAAKLAEDGLVHGQLHYDYQNVTMSGEVCDLDAMVVAPSVHPEKAAQFTEQLRRDESLLEVGILDEYNAELQSLAPDGHSANNSLLEQAYYLFNAALRCFDIKQRVQGPAEERVLPGTVLAASHIDELRASFARRLALAIGGRGAKALTAACRTEPDIDRDFRTPEVLPLLRDALNYKTPIIFGWTHPEKPFNAYSYTTTEQEIGYVLDDYACFKRALQAYLES